MADLASSIANYLLPALPWLLEGARAAGRKAAETLGEEVARALWVKLKAFDRVRQAAQAARALPDNPAMEQALAAEIRTVLHANPALREDLAALLARAGVPLTKDDRSITVHGDVSGSTFVTGDDNTIIQG